GRHPFRLRTRPGAFAAVAHQLPRVGRIPPALPGREDPADQHPGIPPGGCTEVRERAGGSALRRGRLQETTGRTASVNETNLGARRKITCGSRRSGRFATPVLGTAAILEIVTGLALAATSLDRQRPDPRPSQYTEVDHKELQKYRRTRGSSAR